MKKLFVLTAILLLSVAPAMASNFYGKGTLGFFSPSESGLDNSFALYAAGGMKFAGPVSGEVGIGYLAPSDSYVDVTIIPVTTTVLYVLPLMVPKVVFNVGGGLGLYFWNVEADYSYTFLGTTIHNTYEDDGVELGLHLQTGAEYKLNDQISLVGELKWFNTTDVDSVDIGGLSANAGAKINF